MLAVQILSLGDSYTIGEGVPAGERWPVQLAERLRARGLRIDEPLWIARTGWTTAELNAAMQSSPLVTRPPAPYDLATLLIGVNNQYRGLSVDDYRAEFVDLLRQTISLTGNRPGRVVVVSIPDWSVTPYAYAWDSRQVSAAIDAFNQANREESAILKVLYVDITPISRQAANVPDLLASDGLHPSGQMYSAWVDLIEPVAYKALQPALTTTTAPEIAAR